MTFFLKVVNTKVVEKLYTFLVLKFHDFIPSGLRAINFLSSLSGFDRVLYNSAVVCLYILVG